MNFVIELSKTKNDFNAILMIINRLIKMHHYVLCTAEEDDTSAKETAKLLINNVWKLHELSSIIVSNQRSQFVSLVWKTVCDALKINVKLSIAFHSETNKQSEIANQKKKRYLRSYCNYQQNDWFEWLSMIEFASNAVTSAFIELFVFMINYDYESRMSFDSSNSNNIARERWLIRKRVLTQKVVNIVEKIKDIWEFTKKRLINAQESQKRHANQKRNASSEYKEEHMIWLSIKNIKTKRSFRKLNHKWIKSYKVKKVLKDVCQLKLSSFMKIHDTFHISLLRLASNDSFVEQIQFSSLLIVINEENEYEMNDILDSRYHYEKLQYKVAWIEHSSNRVWYSTESFEHTKKILTDYHRRYSNKSKSKLRQIASIKSMTKDFYWLQQAKNLMKNILNKMQAKMNNNEQYLALINTFDRH